MSPFEVYGWTLLGVIISFILPPLFKAAGLAPSYDPSQRISGWWPRIRAVITGRVLAVGALSLVVALLVAAYLGDDIKTWAVALTSGLGWQSILARLMAPGS